MKLLPLIRIRDAGERGIFLNVLEDSREGCRIAENLYLMKPLAAVALLMIGITSYCQKPTYNVISNYDLKLYESQSLESNYSYIPAGKPFKVTPFEKRTWNRAWFGGKYGWIYEANYRAYTGKDVAPELPDTKISAGAKGGKYVSGNGLGAGLAVYFSKSLDLDLHYKRNQNLFHVGFYRQFNGQKGQTKTERLSNYGLAASGDGTFYSGVNLGYSRLFRDKFGIGVTVSIGSKNHFINYKDNRFNAGYYNLVFRKESAVGFGLNLRHFATKTTSVLAGYNTILGAQLGVAFTFY